MNYNRALEFFIENGITLNSDQIKALKEEFLGEAAANPEEKNRKKLCNDIYHTVNKFFRKNKFNIHDIGAVAKLSGQKQFIEGKSNKINIVSGIAASLYTTYARLESLNQVFNLYKNDLLEELNDVSDKYNYSVKSISLNNGIFTIEFNNQTVNESCLDEASGELLKNDQVINTKFFGKPVKVNIHYDSYFGGEFDKKTSAATNKALNTFCTNKGLFSYLYKLHQNMFNDINSDPYYEEGQKVNNAQDLINSIDLGRGLHVYCNPWRDDNSKFSIFVCGEYWCDDEHGFSVSFPQGNVVKVKDPRDAYDKNWEAIGTKIGQASDPL